MRARCVVLKIRTSVTNDKQRTENRQTEKPNTEAPLFGVPMERQVEWANIK